MLRCALTGMVTIVASALLFQTACGELREPVLKKLILPGLCNAFTCHISTPLNIYPPVSGEHVTHLGSGEYDVSLNCGSCHHSYNDNILHRDGFINGYNWLYGIKTPGRIIYFGRDHNINASAHFDHAAGTCSETGADCHGVAPSDNWYIGLKGSCGNIPSCHLGPPLNEYPPVPGAHIVHRYKKYGCGTCHDNYFRNALHRNGSVNASTFDPKTTASGDIVFFDAEHPTALWDDTTANCSNVGCHGDKNWYLYYNNSQCSSCHVYPPLDKYPPSSGLHGKHREYGCLNCHNSYAAGNPLHNNGTINGYIWQTRTSVSGDIVFFSGGGTFDHSTGNCTPWCHGGENWYTGDD